MTSTVLALYGALLSTALAAVQIGTFLSSRRFLELVIGRSYDSTGETIEIKISNRSTAKTELHNIMIGICELSEDGFTRLFSARGYDAFKISHFWGDRGDSLDLPFSLNPGESIYVNFSSQDANRFILRDRSFHPKKAVLANVFEIEIEHSQGTPRRAYFSMDRSDLKNEPELKEADKLSLLRSRIWKLDQPTH
ncbi:hypothetical protein [Chelativorans salis]|uniref:Uncharacterized protein n=1 Tax=Chelativorans salis TaxID=2978478 RepID=A0ABT2LHZ9_9HYPH|nr:hypothetical protein [Chelativorans sp. EGI FJ00035]MCT7373914.1 hypothetical protein [Chelativorans sp. EGI FJ00035]